eukprot:3035344-Prymnesium_polylepis.1
MQLKIDTLLSDAPEEESSQIAPPCEISEPVAMHKATDVSASDACEVRRSASAPPTALPAE